MYRHPPGADLVDTEACTVGKLAVHILLECFVLPVNEIPFECSLYRSVKNLKREVNVRTMYYIVLSHLKHQFKMVKIGLSSGTV